MVSSQPRDITNNLRCASGSFTVILCLVIVVLDQLSKEMVISQFDVGESLPVIPGCFNLTYLRNTGAVWGILQYQNQWLIILSIIVFVLMWVFYHHLVEGRWIYRLAMGLMLGGILGNLIDRLKYGWVTDFLDFYWERWHWPAFNLADSAICVGVSVYLISCLILSASQKNNADIG